MLLRGALVLSVALSLLAAGCLGVREDPAPTGPDAPLVPEPAQRLHVVRNELVDVVIGDSPGVVGVWPYPIETQLSNDFVLEVPNGTRSLDLSMQWFRNDNNFIMVVTHPGGEDRYETGDPPLMVESMLLSASYPDPAPGTWKVHAAIEGLLRGQDTVIFTSWHEHLERPGLPLIPVVEEDGTWHALYGVRHSTLPLAEDLQLDVTTAGGTLLVETHDAPETVIEILPWARAADEERARTIASLVAFNYTLGSTEVHASVQPPGDLAAGESAGAHLILKLPLAAKGTLTVSDGDLVASNLSSLESLTLKSTAGTIHGDVQPSGTLRAVAEGGAIDLTVRAQRDTVLEAVASSGAATIRLPEDAEVGYEIEATSKEGQVTSVLESARLDGEAGQAVLRTQDFDQRNRQVTGTVIATRDVAFLLP